MTIRGAKIMRSSFLFVVLSVLPLVLAAQEPVEPSQREAAPTPQVQQMQSHMQAMREQMARIHATEDPDERQRLMQEHMRSMHEGMMMMGQHMGMMQQMMEQLTEQMSEQVAPGQATETPQATPDAAAGAAGHEEHH